MISINRYNEPTITYGQMNLIFHIRNLWREMATWTRAYLISRTTGMGSPEEVFNRLYRIPREFGNLLQLILGNQIAEQYVQFLSLQLVLIREIIDAQIAGDVDLVNEKVRQLYANAEERVNFITSANPFWDEAVVRNFIYTYHQYTLDEITAFLTGEYQMSIDIYDRLLQLADSIGDYFAQGLFNYITYSPNEIPINPAT